MVTKEQALKTLSEIRGYGPDWDSYGATAISSEAVDTARELIDLISREAPQPVPLNDGGVALLWMWSKEGSPSDIEVEIRIGPNGLPKDYED